MRAQSGIESPRKAEDKAKPKPKAKPKVIKETPEDPEASAEEAAALDAANQQSEVLSKHEIKQMKVAQL